LLTVALVVWLIGKLSQPPTLSASQQLGLQPSSRRDAPAWDSDLIGAAWPKKPQISFDPKQFFAQSYYSPLTAEFEKNFKAIAQQNYPNDKEGFYARFIGVGVVAYQHDVTWFTIYKSQLSALHELNARGSVRLQM